MDDATSFWRDVIDATYMQVIISQVSIVDWRAVQSVEQIEFRRNCRTLPRLGRRVVYQPHV